MKPQILQQQYFARLWLHVGHITADAIERHLNRLSEQFREPRCYGSQTHFRIVLAFGPPEMAGKDDCGSLVQRILDGGKGSADSLVARDLFSAGCKRHIEINADEDGFAAQIQIADGQF